MDGSEESLLDATYLSLPSPFTQACCRPHSSHRPVWRALLSRALGTVRSTDSMIDSCERTASARQRLSLTLFLASHVAQGFVDRALEGLIAPILIDRTQPNAEAGGILTARKHARCRNRTLSRHCELMGRSFFLFLILSVGSPSAQTSLTDPSARSSCMLARCHPPALCHASTTSPTLNLTGPPTWRRSETDAPWPAGAHARGAGSWA